MVWDSKCKPAPPPLAIETNDYEKRSVECDVCFLDESGALRSGKRIQVLQCLNGGEESTVVDEIRDCTGDVVPGAVSVACGSLEVFCESIVYQFSHKYLTNDIYCNEPVFVCLTGGVPDGEYYVLDGGEYTEIDVSDSELNVPGPDGSKVFESEVLDFIQVQATTPVATVQDALDAVEAAGLPDLECKETGQVVPATVDDICAYKVRRIPCGASYLTDPTDAATAVEVGAADAYYVGGISINAAEDTFGAVDPARPVAAGADAVAAWCFKLRRELSKAEIAAIV